MNSSDPTQIEKAVTSKTKAVYAESLGNPKLNVTEDPVCGSGHCHIVPYWAERLGKENIVAYQASRRGGILYCRMSGDKVFLAGKAALFSECELYI